MSPATLSKAAPAEETLSPEDIRRNTLRVIRMLRKEEKEKCEKSYEHFVRCVWDILEPETPLIWNWHLTYLCNLVQSEIERIGRHEDKIWDIIIINIPPRSLKSWIFTRAATAWAWIKHPWMRFMQGSYADDIATEHAMECRDIIQSDWYQSNWGDLYQLKTDQNSKHHYRTNKNGARFTFSTGSKATARGANVISWDDPTSAKQAESEKELLEANKFWTRTLRNRANSKRVDVHWIIMQRLSPNDVTGHILKTEKKKRILHVCLPAEERDYVSPPELKQYYITGLLFPLVFSKEFLEGEKSDAFYYSGQYLQNPTPEEGGMFKRKNWRYWQWPGQNLKQVVERVGDELFYCDVVDRPATFDDSVTSWDMAYAKTKTSDEVSGHGIGVRGANFYILEKEVYGKLGFTESQQGVVELNKAFPFTTQCLIENKANGSAVIETLRDDLVIKGIQATATDSPASRAAAASKIQSCGNMILPHPDMWPFSKEIVDQFAAYNPKVPGEDHRVVSICQAVIYLRFNKPIWPLAVHKTEKIKIDWKKLPRDAILYISQWVGTDNSSSILICLYNQASGKLFILDELIVSSSIPELVIGAVNLKIRITSANAMSNSKLFSWIGNGKMFGRENNSSSSNVNKNTMADAYAASKVSIVDNPFYDESGAITTTARLLGNPVIKQPRQVFFSENCGEANRQVCAWNYEDDKPSAGHGLARALCNVVFSLEYTGKFERKINKVKEYSAEKRRFLDEVDQAEKLGQVEQYLHSRRVNRNGGSKGKDGWMI